MNVLLTYDVSAKQPEIKAKLLAAGYSDRWTSERTTYYLPNTTLWANDKTTANALSAVEQAAKDLKVTLRRAMAVEFTSWRGIPGEPHA